MIKRQITYRGQTWTLQDGVLEHNDKAYRNVRLDGYGCATYEMSWRVVNETARRATAEVTRLRRMEGWDE
jgi:hypothetical protein